MSQWSHIAGLIRIDGFFTKPIPIGKTCKSDSSDEEWNACDVPRGSEGSMQISFTPGRDNSINIGHYTIWGDLRDFGVEDVQEIRDWLGTLPAKLKEHHLSIRQAIVQCEIEYGPTICFQYKHTKTAEPGVFVEHSAIEK